MSDSSRARGLRGGERPKSSGVPSTSICSRPRVWMRMGAAVGASRLVMAVSLCVTDCLPMYEMGPRRVLSEIERFPQAFLRASEPRTVGASHSRTRWSMSAKVEGDGRSSLRLSGFSRTFWVANTLELFERFAYYGSKAVLAVYIAEQVGLGSQTATFLAGSVFNTLLYLLPPLAGTIVDRYGFKKSLTACFAIFALGYFLI